MNPEINLPARVVATSHVQMAESELRKVGLAHITQRVKASFPLMSRREVRKLARQLERESWKRRDPKFVSKITDVSHA